MLFFALTSSTLQADFAGVLKHGFNFSGTFACYETYDIGSVPNPCLKIDGLGVVGLPLNEREAQVIIARSRQVGSGVWEMSSDNVCPFVRLFSLSVCDSIVQVHFINTAWGEWVRSTLVSRVCDALGVNRSPTPPECELYKLLIQEPGSEQVLWTLLTSSS
jgi:hypothetical protein